jgi:hypothetical protein
MPAKFVGIPQHTYALQTNQSELYLQVLHELFFFPPSASISCQLYGVTIPIGFIELNPISIIMLNALDMIAIIFSLLEIIGFFTSYLGTGCFGFVYVSNGPLLFHFETRAVYCTQKSKSLGLKTIGLNGLL